MSKIIFAVVMLWVSLSAGSEDVNSEDKKNVYDVTISGKVTGQVTVSSKFVGDPILEGTKISFSIQCAKGYKLNPKFKAQDSFMAYDYGANGKLSEYKQNTSELFLFYRTALIKKDQPVMDQNKTLTIDLSTACRFQ